MGFSSDERPYGDRFGTLTSHVPTYTVMVDRPRRVAELWPLVDEITAEHGNLSVRSSRAITELYAAARAAQTPQPPA